MKKKKVNRSWNYIACYAYRKFWARNFDSVSNAEAFVTSYTLEAIQMVGQVVLEA